MTCRPGLVIATLIMSASLSLPLTVMVQAGDPFAQDAAGASTAAPAQQRVDRLQPVRWWKWREWRECRKLHGARRRHCLRALRARHPPDRRLPAPGGGQPRTGVTGVPSQGWGY